MKKGHICFSSKTHFASNHLNNEKKEEVNLKNVQSEQRWLHLRVYG